MTLLNFDTQIMKIHFNFFHISVDFKLKKRSNRPSGVAKGGARGGGRPPNRKKIHSLKKAKSVEKLGGGGGTRYILEAETD